MPVDISPDALGEAVAELRRIAEQLRAAADRPSAAEPDRGSARSAPAETERARPRRAEGGFLE